MHTHTHTHTLRHAHIAKKAARTLRADRRGCGGPAVGLLEDWRPDTHHHPGPASAIMSKAGCDDGGGSIFEAHLEKSPSDKATATAATGPGWTKVSCPCCVSERVEPLVLVKLGEKVRPETKRWLIKLIGTPQKEGGAALLAHPGEDATGDIIMVSAPRCTLLQATEELGLCKTYNTGEMETFSYDDRDNFRHSDDMELFLTLAERQYIIKYELEGLRARRDVRIPGLADNFTLQHRDNICIIAGDYTRFKAQDWRRFSSFLCGRYHCVAKRHCQKRDCMEAPPPFIYMDPEHGQKMTSVGVIVETFPLHNRARLKELSKSWYSGNQLSQPLDSVSAYFGSTVGFYFSFLDFYTWSLLPPAILGLCITYFSSEVQKEAVEAVAGSQAEIHEEDAGLTASGHMIQAVFSMLWSTVFMELWKRRSSSQSYRWGTLHLAERFAEPRPGFHGHLGMNPVTGRMEPLFPEWQRDLRMALVSIPVVGLFLGMVVLGMLCFYWGENQVMWLHQEWESMVSQTLLYAPSVLHIVYTNMLATVYKRVAQSLTEFENHREESAFQNHLTAKVLVFTFFNYFAVLFHIAFVKQDVPLLRKRLASLLIVTQLVNQVTEVVIPFLVDRFISAPHRTETEDDPEEDKFRNQITLPVFPGLFAEYIELLVQFGYLSLFSCVYPLTAVLLLINNVMEMRSDAYKICKLFRKPFSAPAANMGVWQIAFEILSFVAVVSNCWLLTLSPQLQRMHHEGQMSNTNIALMAILAEHVLIVVKVIVAALIPDEPEWVRKKRAHMQYTSMQALRQQNLPSEES